MEFEGSIITEQGITFGILIVKSHVLNNKQEANEMISRFHGIMGVPLVVLMAQNSRGIPTYYGRKDLVAFLANIDMRRIPWMKYSTT